jgi:ribosome-associated translation inhibitor RaiA
LPGAGDGSGFALSFAGRRSSVETRPDKEANMAKTGVTPQVSGLERGATLRGRAAKLMTGVVAKLVVGPVRSQVTFTDDNGPKGGRAMRCALTVRLPYRPTLRVERAAETPRLAFDAAFAVLLRQLERYRERDRENRRHPKKYFAATRALAGGPTAPRRQARRG